MNEQQAQSAINSAALILAFLYFYRKLVEPAVPAGKTAPRGLDGPGAQFFGFGEVAPTQRFIIGWGFTFLTLSIVVGFAPELAGYFAVLIAVGAILGNGLSVFEDVTNQLNKGPLKGDAAIEAEAPPTVNVVYTGGGVASPVMPSGSPSKRGTTPRKPKSAPTLAPRLESA